MSTESDYLSNLAKQEIEEDELDIAHPEEARNSDLIELESVGASRLAIVVGHTSRSQGANGVDPVNSFEYPWNDDVAITIKQIATSKGVSCGVFYRDGIGIQGAYKEVEAWKAHTCIELHFNAAGVPAYGTETLHGDLEISRQWAEIVQRDMLLALSRPANRDRGIKLRVNGERGGRSLSQLTTIPSVIVEPFFGHVESDASLAVEHRQAYAEGLVHSHLSYLPGFA